MRNRAILLALSEEVSIGSVVLRNKRSNERVIVVDNGSSDRPAEVADLAGAEAIMHPVDISRAREIGYEPESRLEYRLAETIEWFCS